MNPPYRADHIGSFLRPSELLEARKNPSRDTLQALEDQQICRILTRQKELNRDPKELLDIVLTVHDTLRHLSAKARDERSKKRL